ncbi:BolA-like protein [alpha proteobacterium IMCC14465]|uniref:BolA-like protein n=1 Tax=alpha proteobacterium IMCC14465 TaxID=1220535 RepID=J9DHQ5_9PROT|nr:BolA-like protein [alpha proteobacterium IMCC14465]
MPMTASNIVDMIKEAIPDAQIDITDLRGDGDHYSAVVTSQSFKGKTRVQQHRMVYDALQGDMGSGLHALALQTAIPDSNS